MTVRNQSIVYGFVVSLLGGILASFVDFPFISLIVALIVYFFVLKKKGVNLGYYLVGYFLITILLAVVLATLFGILIFGGLFA